MFGPAILLFGIQLGGSFDSDAMKGAMVSAIVIDLDGTVLYERNADTRAMPASNQKLFSCAYALAKRGPNATNKTRFWVDGSTVTIESEGDPTLPAASLRALRKELKISPNFKVRVKQAYALPRPSTWQIQDIPNRYAPAIHAFSADKGGFELLAGPHGLGFQPHRPAGLVVDYIKSASPIRMVEYSPLGNKLIIQGGMPKTLTRLDTLSDPHPSSTAVSLINGGTGTFATTAIVPSRKPDREIQSPTIGKLIKDCLQPSDNCLAEHLLISTSATKTYEGASKSLTDWLKTEVGIDTRYVRIEDGSGLSRKNQTTARTIAKLLQWSYRQPTRELWLSALASPATGTLSSRLSGIDFNGKTGTLDMVSALSGYVKCKDGETRIVSVILNHYGCSERQARDTIDEFIRNVSEQSLSGTVLEDRHRYEDGVSYGQLDGSLSHRSR